MEKEILLALITGSFSLVGVVGGIIATAVAQSISDKRKFKRDKIKDTYNQFVTLRKLEELYVSEITELRNKAGKECKEKGVLDEFRRKVYSEGAVRITETAEKIQEIANKF